MIPSGVNKFLLAVVVAALLCFAYWRQRAMEPRYQELQKNKQTIENVRREVQDLKVRVDQTRKSVDSMEKDPVKSEASVRKILRYVKPDEKVFHVEETAPTPAGAQPPAVPPADMETNITAPDKTPSAP